MSTPFCVPIEGVSGTHAYRVCHREEGRPIFDKSGDPAELSGDSSRVEIAIRQRRTRNDRLREVGTREVSGIAGETPATRQWRCQSDPEPAGDAADPSKLPRLPHNGEIRAGAWDRSQYKDRPLLAHQSGRLPKRGYEPVERPPTLNESIPDAAARDAHDQVLWRGR